MSTETFSPNHAVLVETVESKMIGAVVFLTAALMRLAESHPDCMGHCPVGADLTCAQVEDAITDLVPALAEALMAAKETVEHLGQRLREPEPVGAVDIDAAIQGLRAQARRLTVIPNHHRAALAISDITIGLIPATVALGDLIEALLA